ncbi:MAG: hypothetical protein DRP45_04580 [Candidatus Zixiibacteriota bacterium]|nr:MAG: hypothetical protein DRP45_04580 [candidate division Zixibacteria bacterium]
MSAPDKLTDWLFYLFLLVVTASSFSIALTQSALALALVIFLTIIVWQRYQPFVRSLRWFYLAVAIYVGWMIISAICGQTPLSSLSGAKEEWLFLIIPVVISLAQDEKKLNWLLTALSVGVILVAAYTAFQFFTRVDTVRMSGNFSHALTYGNYSATAALFLLGFVMVGSGSLKRWQRWLIMFGGVAAVAGTVMGNSRSPIVAMFVGLLLLLLFAGKKWRWLVLAVVAAVIVTVLASDQIRERFTPTDTRSGIERNLGTYWQGSRRFVWENSLKIIREHPVIGIGAGNFCKVYQETVGPELHPIHLYGHSHNDFLNITVHTGIPGGLCFAGLWLTALIYFWYGYRRSERESFHRRTSAAGLLASLVFLATSLTEATFADEEVRTLLMFVWAVGLSGWYKQLDSTNSPTRHSRSLTENI